MKQEKEFDRSRCFMFFESYLESAEKYETLFGTEVAFKYLCGVARYALYQEESKDPMTNGLVSALKNTIDSGQDKRSKGFAGENFEQSKLVAEYYRDHPNASQRSIADATGVSKTKVQKTLVKIKESNMGIDDYISNVINPNLNTNTNTNSNLNSNINSETKTETASQSLSDKKELADAQTNASLPEEEKEQRLLEDLTDAELDSLLKDFRRKKKYADLQKKFNLADGILSKNLSSEIETIKQKRQIENEERRIKEKISKIEADLFKDPSKKEKLKQYLECNDKTLIDCIITLDKDVDNIIRFYEENIDEEGNVIYTTLCWKSKHIKLADNYLGFIKMMMNQNGY